ncbi:ribonuclease H-like domain-containing protein [Mycena haematopus]|nr:ribonuclease H-like domain-containing protein [Mycena haematopus]
MIVPQLLDMQSLSESTSSAPISLPTTRYCWREETSNQDAKAPPRQVYITDATHAEAELSTFKGPCGIDIEWKPCFLKGEPENPVALLQLANFDTILLLHLCHMTRFPTNLQAFLEDDTVKAGVGIQGDAKKLYKDCLVNIRNCVDLSLLARSVDNAHWKGKYRDPIGLARLIAFYENRLLAKGKITRSNWENHLDSSQQEYASNDGHAGYTLYTKLSSMVHGMQNPPHPRCYTFDAIRGRLCEPSGMTWSPFNPDYDPGPPPPPKVPPSGTSVASPAATASSRSLKGQRKRPPTQKSGSSVRSPSIPAEAGETVSTPSMRWKRYHRKPQKST